MKQFISKALTLVVLMFCVAVMADAKINFTKFESGSEYYYLSEDDRGTRFCTYSMNNDEIIFTRFKDDMSVDSTFKVKNPVKLSNGDYARPYGVNRMNPGYATISDVYIDRYLLIRDIFNDGKWIFFLDGEDNEDVLYIVNEDGKIIDCVPRFTALYGGYDEWKLYYEYNPNGDGSAMWLIDSADDSGVQSVTSDAEHTGSGIYDLQGRPAKEMDHGRIYINDGKKVYNK